MLPFTKRPGRNEESEVVSKDDPMRGPSSVPPTSDVKRIGADRAPFHSAPDEMTNIMQSRSFTGPVSVLASLWSSSL